MWLFNSFRKHRTSKLLKSLGTARNMRPVFVPVGTYAVFGKPAQSISSIHVLRSVNFSEQRRLSIWDELRRPCQYINNYFTAGRPPQGLYRTRRYILSIVQILRDLATIDSGGRGSLEKLDHAHGLQDLGERLHGHDAGAFDHGELPFPSAVGNRRGPFPAYEVLGWL